MKCKAKYVEECPYYEESSGNCIPDMCPERPDEEPDNYKFDIRNYFHWLWFGEWRQLPNFWEVHKEHTVAGGYITTMCFPIEDEVFGSYYKMHKGEDKEPGLVFAPYVPLDVTPLIENGASLPELPNFWEIHKEDIKQIDTKYAKYLTFDNIPNLDHYQFSVSNNE